MTLKKLLAVMILRALVIGPLAASAQIPTIPSTPDARADRPRELIEARAMIGMDVRSELDKTIGVVENLLIDPTTGRIDAVVVRNGGVMGIGGKLVVVPWTDLNIAIATDGAKPIATTLEATLEAARAYERNVASPSASPLTK